MKGRRSGVGGFGHTLLSDVDVTCPWNHTAELQRSKRAAMLRD
jgi:hypothetical protein